jgi:trigger factor
MNISLNKASDLQGRLTVVVTEADYKEKVEAKLKDYRKKASIKGFRPGMVPATLIKKLYGQSALVDEINHELGHAVSDYIKENKYDLTTISSNVAKGFVVADANCDVPTVVVPVISKFNSFVI